MAQSDLYKYEPSLATAVIFAIGFLISAALHTYQIFRTRTWFFIPFLLGTIFECIGCVCRGIGSKETPDWSLGPFVIQSLFLLLGPTFYAASIYMILGRIITLLEAEAYSLVKSTWLTKFFLIGDIISIALQGIGGGKLSNAETEDERSQGESLIIGGLIVQVAFFGFFMAVTFIFHRKIKKTPTPKVGRLDNTWHILLMVLYTTSILILIRSAFRLIEYIQGHDGELQSKEYYIYVLDIALMLFASVLLNIFHPSKCFSENAQVQKGRESATQLTDYNSEYHRVGAV
ncbi:uncharacterized protein BROUX77_004187 [Berkeleyomyces rouxiae]|uniref:uncharacterized protein n=1 Tax=Berkeleyomyces rouxiae TaxID=2035830 RepID=UPI003B7C7923